MENESTKASPYEDLQGHVRDLSLPELYRADEAFCTGTMGELAGVVQVDGRRIGDGRTGPMTARLSALYGRRTASGGTRVVD